MAPSRNSRALAHMCISFLRRFLKSSYTTVAVLLGIGILVSFCREILLAYYYGTSKEIEIFRLSVLLPHMLTQNCAPVFMAACLPLLGKYQGPENENRAEKTILVVNCLFSTAVFFVGVLTAGLQARILAPGFDNISRWFLREALHYTWLYYFLASLSLAIRARLLHKEVFWPGSISSAVIGVVFISIVSIYQLFPSIGKGQNTLSVAIIGSGASVLIVHIFASKKYNLKKLRISRSCFSDKLLIPLFYAVVSATIFKLINFVPRVIDRVVATTMDQGVLACLEYSFGMLNIFGILIGTSVSTVIMPRFLKKYTAVGIHSAIKSLTGIIAVTVFVSILISILTAFFSESIIRLVFARGNFGQDAALITSNIFRWQIFALPLVNVTLILSQIIIIMERVRLLLVSVFFKVMVKVVLVYFFIDKLGENIFGITLFASELVFALGMSVFIFKLTHDSFYEKV